MFHILKLLIILISQYALIATFITSEASEIREDQIIQRVGKIIGFQNEPDFVGVELEVYNTELDVTTEYRKLSIFAPSVRVIIHPSALIAPVILSVNFISIRTSFSTIDNLIIPIAPYFF